MDVISIINAIKDIPTDKFVIFFLLIGGGYLVWDITRNNTTAIKSNTIVSSNLNETLQLIISNQKIHDERNKSDFSIVKTDISRVEKDVESARDDVSSLQGDILDIKGNMVTRNEITVVHNRLDSIVTTVGKIEGKVM